jgi:hypothetical protein
MYILLVFLKYVEPYINTLGLRGVGEEKVGDRDGRERMWKKDLLYRPQDYSMWVEFRKKSPWL